MCLCVHIESARAGLEKNIEKFCSNLVFNTVNERESVGAHVLTSAQGNKRISYNLILQDNSSHLLQGSHSKPHIIDAEELRFRFGESYFIIGGRGQSTNKP